MNDEEFANKFFKRLAEIAEDQHQCTVRAKIIKQEEDYEEKKNA